MRFSYQWLNELLPLRREGKPLDPEALARLMTRAGLEVDSVEPAAPDFNQVVVAKIIDCQPHPDADKLQVCRVDDGENELQIVCGAPNARVGLVSALARVGATLPGDFKIKPAKLRGMESFGMLCSGKELGLGDDHDGILELPDDAEPGQSLRELLDLEDHVLEVELTPNRPDCLSMVGLAREMSANTGQSPNLSAPEPVAPTIEGELPIQLKSPADCPRYVGRIIRGIDNSGRSPLWLRERLRRGGLRSVSPVVDVTNYVLLELGQPLHAFDHTRLNGHIEVRRAHDNEVMTLLDGKEASLDDSFLVIADADGAVALAGVMGGQGSAVEENTKDILLESAWFNPATIMGKARALGLHTDASHRFERGVSPAIQKDAIERATQLILGICGGEAAPVLEAVDEKAMPQQPVVELRHARITRLLGVEIQEEAVMAILNSLGMSVQAVDTGWQVIPPPSRPDIAIEEDLIEEVARIHGYDRIPAQAPAGEVEASGTSEHRLPLNRLRLLLADQGYLEALTYSFVDRELLETLGLADRAFALANPLASDLNVMRTALLPGLLMAARRNLNRQQSRVRLFEAGTVFNLTETAGTELTETQRIGAIIAGDRSEERWDQKTQAVDFFDAKGAVEALAAASGHAGALSFEKTEEPWLHPGQRAAVQLSGQTIGWIGAIHPSVVSSLDIQQPLFAFELDLEPLLKRDLPRAQPVSRFPSIRRDLALLVPAEVSYADIRSVVRSQAGEFLREIRLFDVYQGDSLKENRNSVAIGLILQDVSSTLTDEKVDAIISTVMESLEEQLDVRLRS